MKLLQSNLVKAEIMDQINATRNWLSICTYSTEIANIELFHFIKLIEVGGMIELVVGKELHQVALTKLSRLYNIRVLFLKNLHAKICLNESSVIVSSCNFGGLLVPRFIECGVRFSKQDYPREYKAIDLEINEMKKNAQVLLPMLPFKPNRPLDLKDLLK
jgi:hypothetical protein